MSSFFAFLLLGVISQAFTQNVLQRNEGLDIFQTNRAADQQNNSPISGPSTNNDDSQLEENDLNSPILSKFSAYNLQVLEEDGLYPILFNVSLSPNDARKFFYNEAISFALDNGVHEVGDLPQQLADAAAQAFPNLTPFKFFKATSNIMKLFIQKAGLATEGNYQELIHLISKSLKDAKDSSKLKDAQSALHAIHVGTAAFLRSVSLTSPDHVRNIIAAYADQLFKVPTNSEFQ